MRLEGLVQAVPLTVFTKGGAMTQEVVLGYASDLLSQVVAEAAAGSVWITMQRYPGIVAVASLRQLAAVIVAGGVQPETETVNKARQEGIVLCGTALSAFETVGRLHRLGVVGG